MPNVPGVVVIATERLDALVAERDALRDALKSERSLSRPRPTGPVMSEQEERGGATVEMEAHNERAMRAREARELAVQAVAVGVNVVPEVAALLLDSIRWYEDGITWQTSCTHCASVWDRSYDQHEQIESLKAQLATLTASIEYREVLSLRGQAQELRKQVDTLTAENEQLRRMKPDEPV